MDGLVKGVAEQKHTAPAHLNFKADFYLARGGEDFVPAGTQSCFSMGQQVTLRTKRYDTIVGHVVGSKDYGNLVASWLRRVVSLHRGKRTV
jgi:hypothetical protein